MITWMLLATALASPEQPWALDYVDEGYVYRLGDDLAWADPDLDDSDWEPHPLNTDWRRLTGEFQEWGWVRLRVEVEPGEPLGVFVHRAYQAADIYVDGEKLFTWGEPGARAGVRLPYGFEVPAEATEDGEIVLAARIWGGWIWNGAGWFEGFQLGLPEAVVQRPIQGLWRRWKLTQGLAQLLLGLALAGIGSVHGYLWWRRREPEQGIFAVGSGMLGASIAYSALLYVGSVAPSWGYYRFTGLFRCCAYIALIWFTARFLRHPSQRGPLVATAALLFTGIWAGFAPLPPWWDVTYFGYVIAALVGIWMIGRGLRHRVPGAATIAVGFVPLCAWGFMDLVGNVLISNSSSYYQDVRPWFMIAATGGIVGAMSLALASRFADTLAAMEATWRASARFVPDAFLGLLGRRNITEVRRGDSTSRDITVMFCGIPRFNELTESWSPEESFAFLNRFLAVMEPHIHDNGGFVAQYLGDGFLALFPVGQARPVKAAVAMQQAAQQLEEDVQLAIGLHTGPVMLGTVGSERRLTTGQVSDVVNTSARIKGLTKHYGAPLVISEATRALAEEEGWALNELDAVVMKGKTEPMRAFEVLGGEPDPVLRKLKEREAPAYREGLEAFRAGELDQALSRFSPLAEQWVAARLFVQRCDWFLTHGLPDDWDGVVRMTVK